MICDNLFTIRRKGDYLRFMQNSQHCDRQGFLVLALKTDLDMLRQDRQTII